MKTLLLISISLLSFLANANINYIDYSKICDDNKLLVRYTKIKDNSKFYDHWTQEWNYEVDKNSLITLLESSYKKFNELNSKSSECELLLGTISHYLYNMDVTNNHENVINHYNKVISNNPKDYRAFWFLGFHYSSSNHPKEGIENLLIAKDLIPEDGPADFWQNYAFATSVANMPTNAIYGMEKYKSITGKKSYLESQLGDVLRQRIKDVDKTKFYNVDDIWTVQQDSMAHFTCRPLGLKVKMDTAWNLSVHNYENEQSAFMVIPPKLANKEGKEIGYTIAILMITADKKDKLEDFVNIFLTKYTNKKKVTVNNNYDKMISYEITDKNMYQEMGGAHMYFIGIERNAPEYPGLILESPQALPGGGAEGMQFFNPADSKNRFKGKIFYAVMLDSCEDIHEDSYKIFKDFLENNIIIE